MVLRILNLYKVKYLLTCELGHLDACYLLISLPPP